MPPRCTHVKDRGGAKAAMRLIQAQLPANRFVLRADVKSYYASIDHVLLMDRLAQFIRDRTILNLCGQYWAISKAHRRALSIHPKVSATPIQIASGLPDRAVALDEPRGGRLLLRRGAVVARHLLGEFVWGFAVGGGGCGFGREAWGEPGTFGCG